MITIVCNDGRIEIEGDFKATTSLLKNELGVTINGANFENQVIYAQSEVSHDLADKIKHSAKNC